MKFQAFVSIMLALALLSGCISLGGQVANNTGNANASNATGQQNATAGGNETGAAQNATGNETNQTAPPELPKTYDRYLAKGFSFEYPSDMDVQESKASYGGVFSGTHSLDGQTGEILIVSYINISAYYGANKESVLAAQPTKAASDFLVADKDSDPVGSVLSEAYEVGEITTFGVARDGYVAEAPFKTRFGAAGKSYTGHAMDIYIPERSLLARVRIVALDSDKAAAIRDNLLLSLRIEAQ